LPYSPPARANPAITFIIFLYVGTRARKLKIIVRNRVATAILHKTDNNHLRTFIGRAPREYQRERAKRVARITHFTRNIKTDIIPLPLSDLDGEEGNGDRGQIEIDR
jgi:hypothetical protein